MNNIYSSIPLGYPKFEAKNHLGQLADLFRTGKIEFTTNFHQEFGTRLGQFAY